MSLPPPAPESRVFTLTTRVRLGDVSPRGRLRLDGIAKLLQDVATDDAEDGAPGEEAGWVVVRVSADMMSRPQVIVERVRAKLRAAGCQT